MCRLDKDQILEGGSLKVSTPGTPVGIDKVLRGSRGILRGLNPGVLAQDGRRALGISLIVFYNKCFDIWV